MLAEAAWRTLQMLVFRAGPQDFPYAETLNRALPFVSVAGNAALLAVVLPPALALAMAVTMVVVMGAFTRGLLRARNVLNRFAQTFNSLLATDLAFKLLMLPLFLTLAPKFAELARDEQLLANPERVMLPQGPVLVLNLLTYWSFAVSVNIFRHASGLGILLSAFLTFLALTLTLFATVAVTGLVKATMG